MTSSIINFKRKEQFLFLCILLLILFFVSHSQFAQCSFSHFFPHFWTAVVVWSIYPSILIPICLNNHIFTWILLVLMYIHSRLQNILWISIISISFYLFCFVICLCRSACCKNRIWCCLKCLDFSSNTCICYVICLVTSIQINFMKSLNFCRRA